MSSTKTEIKSNKQKKVLHEGLGIMCMSMREACLLADSCTLAQKDSQRTKFILECLRYILHRRE